MPIPTFRDLPAVAAVLEAAALSPIRGHFPPADVTNTIRNELDALRSQIAAGEAVDVGVETVALSVANRAM